MIEEGEEFIEFDFSVCPNKEDIIDIAPPHQWSEWARSKYEFNKEDDGIRWGHDISHGGTSDLSVEFFVEFKRVVIKYEFNECKDGRSSSAIVRSLFLSRPSEILNYIMFEEPNLPSQIISGFRSGFRLTNRIPLTFTPRKSEKNRFVTLLGQ